MPVTSQSLFSLAQPNLESSKKRGSAPSPLFQYFTAQQTFNLIESIKKLNRNEGKLNLEMC